MATIKVNDEEREILIRILDEYFSELRMEISNTENWEFKKGLKAEETLLNRILGELRTDKAMDDEKTSRNKKK